MKKILLMTLMALGLSNTASVYAMQAESPALAAYKAERLLVAQERAANPGSAMTQEDILNVQAAAKTKLMGGAIVSLGLAMTLGTPAVMKVLDQFGLAVKKPGNVVDNLFSGAVAGVARQATNELDAPTEVQLHTLYDKCLRVEKAIEAAKVASQDTRELEAELKSLTRQRIDIACRFYMPLAIKAKAEYKKVQDEVEKLTTLIEEATKIYGPRYRQLIADLSTKISAEKDPLDKADLVAELKDVTAKLDALPDRIKVWKEKIKELNKEITEQGLEDQKTKPNKVTKATQLHAKFRVAQAEFTALTPEDKALIEAEQAKISSAKELISELAGGRCAAEFASGDEQERAAVEQVFTPGYKAQLDLLLAALRVFVTCTME